MKKKYANTASMLPKKNAFEINAPSVSLDMAITGLAKTAFELGAKHCHEQTRHEAEPTADQLKALVSIANNFWRARKRMSDLGDGEVREDMKRIHDRIEAIRRSLVDVGIVISYHPEVRDEAQPKIGIVIRDHTGEAYDEGQPMKVIASKPTPGLKKKYVSETLLPSIFWKNQLVQNGEIEIATPASADAAA